MLEEGKTLLKSLNDRTPSFNKERTPLSSLSKTEFNR